MPRPVDIALFEPDIPQNTGAVMRTAACLGVPVHIIEPCGFVLSDARLRRAGMDYLDRLEMTRHASWARFRDALADRRLVLLTTRAETRLPEFDFAAGDVLLFGRESAGVPEAVHAAADRRVRVPLAPGTRSLNLAASAAMVLATALDRLGAYP
ncbi:MAG: rRNA methyltransferase [Rhodospirillales bacterium CG15_BIG_FIL_POST_REV_8_21_14_020_66_15]|nr:MAG: rRNA methyltransferase [Rhodospirillales bacterium CG15_BIG_FIL_POST_REV_8_21_14_020_66_15]